MLRRFCFATAMTVFASSSYAVEYPIGQPQYRHGMEIAAVYLQPVVMEPDGMMLPADNPNGFEADAWLPYLNGSYRLVKSGSEKIIEGELMPMVASDGPHYGDNVKLDGPGEYTLTFFVAPPSASGHHHFGRHTDRLTGVRPWFKPFEVSYRFVFAGIGKKGGY